MKINVSIFVNFKISVVEKSKYSKMYYNLPSLFIPYLISLFKLLLTPINPVTLSKDIFIPILIVVYRIASLAMAAASIESFKILNGGLWIEGLKYRKAKKFCMKNKSQYWVCSYSSWYKNTKCKCYATTR